MTRAISVKLSVYVAMEMQRAHSDAGLRYMLGMLQNAGVVLDSAAGLTWRPYVDHDKPYADYLLVTIVDKKERNPWLPAVADGDVLQIVDLDGLKRLHMAWLCPEGVS